MIGYGLVALIMGLAGLLILATGFMLGWHVDELAGCSFFRWAGMVVAFFIYSVEVKKTVEELQ